LDPTFAPAWASLAQIIVADEGWSSRDSYIQTCTRGRRAIDEALKLSTAISSNHRVLASVLYNCDWNWKGAEGEYQRALALDPGNAETLRQYATFAWSIRRPQQAIDLAQKAVLRDPLDPWSYQALALAQNESGQIEDSIASWRKALDLDPTVGLFIALLANAYLADGKPAQALSTIDQEPIDQMKQMNLPFIYEALGRKEEATRALASFEDHYGAHALPAHRRRQPPGMLPAARGRCPIPRAAAQNASNRIARQLLYQHPAGATAPARRAISVSKSEEISSQRPSAEKGRVVLQSSGAWKGAREWLTNLQAAQRKSAESASESPGRFSPSATGSSTGARCATLSRTKWLQTRAYHPESRPRYQ